MNLTDIHQLTLNQSENFEHSESWKPKFASVPKSGDSFEFYYHHR